MRHTGVKEFYPNNLHVLNLIDGIRKKKQSKTKHNKIKTTTTTNKQIKKIKKNETKRNRSKKKKKKEKRKTDRVRALIREIEANSKSRHKLSIGPLLYPSIS